MRALRPALLGAAASGLLPVSCSDGSWKLCSLPAARSALIATLLLALYLLCVISHRDVFFNLSSTAGVILMMRALLSPLRWAGMFVWLWASAPHLEAYARACSQYEERFGPVDLRQTTRYVRRYAISTVLVLLPYPFQISTIYTQYPVWFQAAVIGSTGGMYCGMNFWPVILDGTCWSLADAFRGIDERLRMALQKGNVPQMRRLARQHGHVSQLSSMFCGTYGGFLAAYFYTVLLDITLAIYMSSRALNPVGGGSPVHITIEVLVAPLSLILLKLTTNAGHRVIRQSQQAAELLRGHMLASSQAADDPDFTEILQKLEGQQVRMNMSGYFVLDKDLFIQSVKDIVTLIIALAQFEMADPN